jgi:hypothetical protein
MLLRLVLGPFMLAWEELSWPKGISRSPERQRGVDHTCEDLALYQFRTCPFCIKVRQEMRRLSLNVARLDAQAKGQVRNELVTGGWVVKVPCPARRQCAGRLVSRRLRIRVWVLADLKLAALA